MHLKIVYFILLVMTITACKSVQQGLFSKQSPHEEYTSKLKDAGLDGYKLSQSWNDVAEESILNPVVAEIPFSEALVFDYNNLSAASYKVFLREGQQLHILAEPEQNDSSLIFIDIFHLQNNEVKLESHAEKDSTRLSYMIRRDGEYLIRIQPELLTQGLFTIYLFTGASLNFPVPDRDFNSISSFYGDPRDGGHRQHEGVDVFAPRGTPVLSVGSGRVARTGTNRLGGKVVWVTDSQRGYNYYYAHLDSQLVKPGWQVSKGDTLGLIGNTGNAVTTAPHLHFGIYAFGRRSIDPYVFFHRTEMPLIDSLHIRQYAGKWGKTTSRRTNFRAAPDMNAGIYSSLPPDLPLKITGVTGKWLRVELPEGEKGFVHQSLVEQVLEPIEEINADGMVVRIRPDSSTPALTVAGKKNTVYVYAKYDSFLLIGVNNSYGWIEAGS
jgi:peptidoglycan LD-endopeptidase LytH